RIYVSPPTARRTGALAKSLRPLSQRRHEALGRRGGCSGPPSLEHGIPFIPRGTSPTTTAEGIHQRESGAAPPYQLHRFDIAFLLHRHARPTGSVAIEVLSHSDDRDSKRGLTYELKYFQRRKRLHERRGPNIAIHSRKRTRSDVPAAARQRHGAI